MSKIKMAILSFCLIILVILFYQDISTKDLDVFPEVYIRYDIEPIKNCFNINRIANIKKVCWISGNDNTISLGPTDIYVKGFIEIDKKEFNDISFSYSWTETNIFFDENFQPYITGFKDFKWFYSEEFSNDLRGIDFMGNAYVDMINNIIYFDFNTF